MCLLDVWFSSNDGDGEGAGVRAKAVFLKLFHTNDHWTHK